MHGRFGAYMGNSDHTTLEYMDHGDWCSPSTKTTPPIQDYEPPLYPNNMDPIIDLDDGGDIDDDVDVGADCASFVQKYVRHGSLANQHHCNTCWLAKMIIHRW